MSVPVRLLASATCLAVAAIGTQAHAATATFQDQVSEIREALAFGKTSLMARYRYEQVNQQGNLHEAHASTLRIAFGYETKPLAGFSLFGQVEAVAPIGQRLYSYPGHATQYPTVVDPTGTELNQAFIRYQWPVGNTKFSSKIGRQEIILNNQRFIGPVAWRQNQQTFDAVTGLLAPIKDVAISGGYISKVHRISGGEARNTGAGGTISANDGVLGMDSTFANAGYKKPGFFSVNAYAVLLQYQDVPSLSSKTGGVRLEGPWKIDTDLSFLYAIEVAQQKKFANTPAKFSAGYWQAEAGVAYQKVTVKVGWNQLDGASATDKFNTPLATGHAFNGWAEQFLTTPNAGLSAGYVSANAIVPWVEGLSATLIGYAFRAQTGGQHYGREWDGLIEYKAIPIDKNLLFGLKVGHFKASTGAPFKDLTKTSLYSVYSF